MGYSLALFQLSTLVTVYLGHLYFAEGNIRRRLLGSLIMVTGAVLIVTFGRPRFARQVPVSTELNPGGRPRPDTSLNASRVSKPKRHHSV